eukprot:SAG22_NODE_8_length_37215_cov_120.960351_19_plen_1710_part_00
MLRRRRDAAPARSRGDRPTSTGRAPRPVTTARALLVAVLVLAHGGVAGNSPARRLQNEDAVSYFVGSVHGSDQNAGTSASPAAAYKSRSDDSTESRALQQLEDPIGMPFVPMGFYSAAPLRDTSTNIREYHEGPKAVTPIALFHGGDAEPTTGCDASAACGWDLIDKWLNRSDAVGSAVFFPLDSQFSAAKSNSTTALAAITTIVSRVKHHRCIVGWYIADEPDGAISNVTLSNANAKVLGLVHNHLKTLDRRPASICVDSTPPYLDGAPNRHNFPAFLPFADIIWADIYPVNHHWANGLSVAKGIQLLRNKTIQAGFPTKQIVLTSQAFGGTECYPREPTAIEARLMTYLAWIYGASGVMAFTHSNPVVMDVGGGADPHLRYPSSTNLWSENKRLAYEGAEFTLGLLSDRTAETHPATVTASNESLHAAVLRETRPNSGVDSVVVLVANTANELMLMQLTLAKGSLNYDNHAVLLFHHRNVTLVPAPSGGGSVLTDFIDALGTRAYRIFLTAEKGTSIATADPKNVLLNPSFEYSGGSGGAALSDERPNIAGGNAFPDGYWTMVGNDTSATAVVDNRDSVDGLRSMRLHTPADKKGLMVVSYPTESATWHGSPTLKPGQKWTLSVWARAPAGAEGAAGTSALPVVLRFGAPYYYFYSWGTKGVMTPGRKPCAPPKCYVSDVTLTENWTKYELAVTSPDPLWHSSGTSWTFVELLTAGVALVDLMELIPAASTAAVKTDDTPFPSVADSSPAQHEDAVGYFVDSVRGSDQNVGTSATQPWRTLARLAGAPLAPSDQVKLARGSIWRECLTIAGGGNAAAGPLTYTSYGPASAPKPLLLGSKAVGGAGNWSAVPGFPGQWRTFPAQLIPAPGAVSLLHNADFAAGSLYWSLWNENPEGVSHVSGGVNTSLVLPPSAGVNRSFSIRLRSMDAVPTSYTQFYTRNVSVVAGCSYRLSFWAKSSVTLNVSELALFAMAPPYTPYAAAAGPVLLQGEASVGWSQYHVDFLATANASRAAGNQARITWLFANTDSPSGKSHPTGGLPNNADIHIAGATFQLVIDAHPARVNFYDAKDVGNLLLFSDPDATVRAEPEQTGWKILDGYMEGHSSVKKDGDFHFDRATKLLTVFCTAGPPHMCWPGGIEAALDTTQINMLPGTSHVVVDGLALRYGAAHGVNTVYVTDIVVRKCDIAWVGGGVLSYDFRSTGRPVRYGNGIQTWNGAKNVEIYGNRLWQIYDTPLTNQGAACTSDNGSTAEAEACAMRNISFHHNLAINSGDACVEIWYNDNGTSMDTVRFENNLCANIGNGGWSAAQRADPAGRGVCFFRNTAHSSNVSLRNNIFYQTEAFEAMLYLSDPWSLWAATSLEFSHNALFKTAATPPPPPSHAGSLDEHDDYVKLIGASPMHINTAADFARFSQTHRGAGAHTVLVPPGFRGLPLEAGGAVEMEAVTRGGLVPSSKLIGAGSKVLWKHDFFGTEIPEAAVDIGPFQSTRTGRPDRLKLDDDVDANAPTAVLTHATQKILKHHSIPGGTSSSGGGSGPLELMAARNEYEPLLVIITGGAAGAAALGNVLGQSLTVSAVKCSLVAAGRPLPAAVYRVGYIEVVNITDCQSLAGPGDYPDPLIPDVDSFVHEKRNAFPLTVPAGENRQVLVDLFVPPETPGGPDRVTPHVCLHAAHTFGARLQVCVLTWSPCLLLRAAVHNVISRDLHGHCHS